MNKDQKYMELCIAGGRIFSTCSRRHFMAIVLDQNGRIASTGYNGGPPGMGHCVDGYCPRAQVDGSSHDFDNCIAIHAELNALLFSEPDRRHTLYINGTPCYGCAKNIAVSGIKRVVYLAEDQRGSEGIEFLINCGIEVEKHGIIIHQEKSRLPRYKV